MKKVKTLFVLHEQFGHFTCCPGYTEVFKPFICSGYVGEFDVFVYQRPLRKMRGAAQFGPRRHAVMVLNKLKEQIGDEEVVIFCAGKHSEDFIEHLKKFNIVCFADENPRVVGTRFHGYDVVSVSDVPSSVKHLVISSFLHEKKIGPKLRRIFPDRNIYTLYDGFMSNHEQLKRVIKSFIGKELLNRVYGFRPELLVYTPTWAGENIPKQYFVKAKAINPDMKIFTIWWDFDDEGKVNSLLDLENDSTLFALEKASLEFADFIAENSNYTRLAKLYRREGIYRYYPNVERVYWWPTIFDPEYYQKLYLPKKYDIAIFGSPEGKRAKWIEFLSKEYGDRFHHFGTLQEREASLKNNWLPKEEYVKKINETKIFVNTQTLEWRVSFKGKVREALACGTFVLEEDNPETRAFVKEGTGVIYFNGEKDLKSKIDYYLSHDKEREEIAERGYRWFNDNFSHTKWVRFILEKLEIM